MVVPAFSWSGRARGTGTCRACACWKRDIGELRGQLLGSVGSVAAFVVAQVRVFSLGRRLSVPAFSGDMIHRGLIRESLGTRSYGIDPGGSASRSGCCCTGARTLWGRRVLEFVQEDRQGISFGS